MTDERQRVRGRVRRPPSHWLALGVVLVGFVLMLSTAGLLRPAPAAPLGHPLLPSPAATGPVIDVSTSTLRSGHGDGTSVGLALVGLPSDRAVDTTLAALRRDDARATWFVRGVDVARRPATVARIRQAGLEIGVTGYTGADLRAIRPLRVRFELSVAQAALAAREGITSPLMLLPRTPTRDALDRRALLTARTAAARGYVLVAGTAPSSAAPGDVAVVRMTSTEGSAALGDFVSREREAGVPVRAVGASVGLRPGEANPRAAWWTTTNGRLVLAAVASSRIVTGLLPVLFLPVTFLVGLRALLALVLATRHARRRRPAAPWTGPVTVIVPAYNEAAGIEAAVRSLAASSWSHGLEIIVVDDGSHDGTADLVEALAIPSVAVVRQENKGKPGALNTGVALASAGVVVLVDGDTVFQPDTIETLVAPFVDERVGAVSGNAKVANRTSLLGRWQHIEYVMGFNLDRRLLDTLHAIPTVPGAVGAFRRAALLDVGGVSDDTIAEDTDLTIAISRAGWRVVYEPDAVAWTEAPSSAGDLWRQRYRWCYGTLQAAWKHRHALVEGGPIGLVGIPYALVFQVLVALLAPIVDIAALYGLLTGSWAVVAAWAAFTGLQVALAAFAFALERESWRPLWAVPLQQLFYRQLMYLVVIQSVASALVGARLRWHKLHRVGVGLGRVEPAPNLAPPMDSASGWGWNGAMSIGADHDPARAASACPVCAEPVHTVDELAVHLVERAGASEVAHVMWLNRNVTKHRVDAPRLAELLRAARGATGGSASADRVNR